MKTLNIGVAAAFVAGIASAYAANHTIRQKGKVFSEVEISVKKGEEILFLNDDTIAHNVLSTSPGNRFNLGLLQPGELRPVKFSAAGELKVICAIHPTMKMTVKVSD